jgi:hypothetical protein
MVLARLLALLITAWLCAEAACAQDLTPRAYVITPTTSNAVGLTYSYSNGSVFTDPTLPLTDFTARFHTQILSYYRSFGLAGRSANVAVALPYVAGNFRAIVAGDESRIYRSGLADSRVRVSVNLKGGPAMGVKEFLEWREKLTIGASLTVTIPAGQYDAARAINPSIHRWAFKPELGFSRRFGDWSIDLYGGAWLFTDNSKFFPHDRTRSQSAIGGAEAHLVRYLTRRCWVSLDGNFWAGGRTTVDGVRREDYQKNSRIGATVAIPVTRHQSIKFSYNSGAYVSIGGDYRNVSVGWQYSWIERAM